MSTAFLTGPSVSCPMLTSSKTSESAPPESSPTDRVRTGAKNSVKNRRKNAHPRQHPHGMYYKSEDASFPRDPIGSGRILSIPPA